jgi:type IV pilus assembly protein PilA
VEVAASGNHHSMKTRAFAGISLARGERGLTLVEVVVATVILGGLAAVAMPSFLNQRSKGSDAEAKSAVVTASRAMEACASDHGGSYSSCSKAALVAVQPALGDLDDRLEVTPGASTYKIAIVASRDASVTFTLSRSTDGTTSRTCSTGTVERGGCLTPSTGTW